MVAAYAVRDTAFKFRGHEMVFALSQELFSSAGIDTGSRLLLKALSDYLGEETRAGRPLPRTVLDAGSGVGVLGVAAARALGPGVRVRAQDRDELARVFTEYNARRNGVGPETLTAHTEVLLEGAPEGGWDLILSNVPAKAGPPVLADLFKRVPRLLSPEGRAFLVVVNPLDVSLPPGSLLREFRAPGHRVLVGGWVREDVSSRQGVWGAAPPTYRRYTLDYVLEGVPCHIDTFWGAPSFDRPSAAVAAAAKLTARLRALVAPPVLCFEDDQGHFGHWLGVGPVDFAGRNVISLEAARGNVAGSRARPVVGMGEAGGPYRFVAAFPRRAEGFWEGVAGAAGEGCVVVAGMGSGEAARVERGKPAGWRRLGDLRRGGFRAMAWGRGH